MKNALKYLALWQKKRSEWQVDDDPQSDWLQMQSLLDQHMPSVNPKIGGGSSGIKALSLWAKLGIMLSAGIIIYSAYYLLSTKAHKQQHSNKVHKENVVNPGANVSHSITSTGLNTDSQSQLSIGQSLSAQVNDTNGGTQSVLKPGLPAQNSKAVNPVANSKSTQGASIQSSTGGNAPVFNRSSISSQKSPNNKPANLNNRDAGALYTASVNEAKKHNGNTFSSSHERNNRPITSGGRYAGAAYGANRDNPNHLGDNRADYATNSRRRGNNNSSLLPHIKSSRLNNINNSRRTAGYAIDNSKLTSPTGNKTTGVVGGLNAKDNNRADTRRENYPDLVVVNPGLGSIGENVKIISSRVVNYKIIKGGAGGKSQITVNKMAKAVNTKSSSLNWGILMGVNSSGSFTPKSQNANFYGHSPIDLFFGPFVTYNFNDKWAVNTQLRLLNPQSVVTTYSHSNGSNKVDSGQLLTITSSRKMYSVSIPLYAVYKLTPNISLKLGPVINIPTKQIDATSILQPYSIRTDTTYYKKIRGELDSTSYQQKLNYGLSGGVSIRVKRFIFEATYLKSLSGYQVSSGLGSAKSKNGTFQFTIGFQFK